MKEYQISKGIHSTDIGERDFEEIFRELQNEIPRGQLEETHVLWGGERGRMCSARCYDRATMSTLLYSHGQVMFVPGPLFAADEPLYAHYLLLTGVTHDAQVSN